jgi:integrase
LGVAFLGRAGELADLLDTFCARYPNTTTRNEYAWHLSNLFRTVGRQHPSYVTDEDLTYWCSGGGRVANNTIRQRVSMARVFFRWCARNGHIDPTNNPAEVVADKDSPLSRYQRTYGKVQARNPGRWLTRDEAYGRLIGACREDDSLLGLRDEIGIRMGLLGMRAAEVAGLRLEHLHLNSTPPVIAWTGKGHKPRRVVPGEALLSRLSHWFDAYATALERPPSPGEPILCRGVNRRRNCLRWGVPLSANTFYTIVRTRAEKAGLGHVAPHDLRRTAAGILHHAVDSSGGHYFDLLAIQKVLGHSDPATTMRSYLDPLDTAVIDRAAGVLD